MPGSIHFDQDSLVGFILIMTRVTGALFLLPLPGFQQAAQPARIALIASTSICLMPIWKSVAAIDAPLGMAGAIASEATMGVLIGLTIAFLFETFQITSQIVSTQSGFGFASTIDPQTQADSALFQIFSQLMIGMLFFALDVHQQLIRILARSFGTMSLAGSGAREASAALIIRFGSKMFLNGFKLAFPIVVLLFLVDFGLTALTRLQSQMQLLNLAFPVKILLSIMFLSIIVIRWPGIFQRIFMELFNDVFRLFSMA